MDARGILGKFNFRRTLCNLLGRDVENGELPGIDLVGPMVRNICYGNASRFSSGGRIFGC